MSELILGAVIIGLLVEVAYLTKSNKDQVDKLTKAVLAKNLTEYTSSAIIEKESAKSTLEPDLIPLEDADDKLFNQAIKT